ncbi:MAG: hypothetical protein SF069_04715 [Phycisphaerae bacterium]|nr:hypothetical protein [Phycisphaerae bacterium]
MSELAALRAAGVGGVERRVVAIVGGRRISAPARPSWLAWLLAIWCLTEAGQHIFGAKVYYQLGAAAGSRGRFGEFVWRTPVAVGYLALAGGILGERGAARASLRILTAGSAAIGAASYLAPEGIAEMLDMGRLAQTPRVAVVLIALAAWRLRFAGERQRHFDGRLTGRDWIRVPRANPAAPLRVQFARRGDAWRVRRAAVVDGAAAHSGAKAIDTAILHVESAWQNGEWVDVQSPTSVAGSMPKRRSTIDPIGAELGLRSSTARAVGLWRLRSGDRDCGWMIEYYDAPIDAARAETAAKREEAP